MGTYARYSGFAATGTVGTGTVTSVGLADGSTSAIYTITGSPVTTAGTLTFSLKTRSANTVFAGPTTGAAAQPSFRSLVAADLPFSVGNITDGGTDGITITGGTGAIIGSGVTVAQHVADSTHNGYLSSTDWSTFNSKQSALTIGNLTDAGTDGITITGGTGSVIGSGTSIAQHVADTTHNGYLSSTDWNTFNGKQAALTIGNLTDAGTDGITITGGTGAVIGSGTSIAQHVADSTHNGYLSSADWTTFNGKGDVVGPASAHDGGLVLFDGTTGKLIKESTLTQHNMVIAGANGTLTSLAPGTARNVGISDGTDWASRALVAADLASASVQASKNFLINGAFDWWQRGTSITGIANAASTYGPDRWYAKNSLGTNGVMSLVQTTGVTDGSIFGCQVKITTAPTAAQTNGCEFYQTVENPLSIALYNKTASFSILVKALNNVNQVGVQFYYKTTEAKVDTSIGSEQTYTVNSATFTTCTISGQALGTSQTTSGVIGIRIRITGVSSGNTYDLNNGFICEQAVINLGTNPATFFRAGATPQSELAMCQRFYEKSFDTTTALATATTVGAEITNTGAVATAWAGVRFKVYKRAVPGTLTLYSPNSGTSGKVFNVTDGADVSATIDTGSMAGCRVFWTNTANKDWDFHWQADAEI